MEPYLESALRRAAIKLSVGLAVIGVGIGLRIVTARPSGIEGEIAELERFEAESAAQAIGGSPPAQPGASQAGESAEGEGLLDSILPDAVDAASAQAGGPNDPDRMVRCRLDAGLQFMRAADCATRGGALEELPPPEPETEP